MNENLETDIDRLVDGELSRSEYKRLLTTFDTQPEAWRRCALAFIETQALRRELDGVRAEYVAPSKEVAYFKQNSVASSPRQTWPLVLAMAASFLVALPLGAFVFSSWDREAPMIVNAPRHAPARIAPDAVVDASPNPLGSLRLTTDDGAIDIPYYDLQHGGKYLRTEQDALEQQLVQSLQRAGHRIEVAPTVMPVELDNGAQVYLPVDTYRITPVSSRPVQ